MYKDDAEVALLDKGLLIERSPQTRSHRTKWLVWTLLACLPLSLAFSLLTNRYLPIALQSPNVPSCAQGDARALPVKAPRPNVWSNIDQDQALQIRQWLSAPERGFNLTKFNDAGLTENTILLIEASQPLKSQVIPFLEGKAAAPAKYAHAVIQHGAANVIKDWLIGPLPIDDSTTIRQLTEIYHEATVPLNARSLFGPGMKQLGAWIVGRLEPLQPIFQDLVGGQFHGHDNDTLVLTIVAPLSYDGEWRRGWIGFKYNVPGSFLHPVGLYFYVDISGNDSSAWKVHKAVYNHQVYQSPEDFAAAYQSGSLKRAPVPDHSVDWATRTRKGKGFPRDLDDRAGPRSVMLSGPRFRADLEEKFITWMGWSFYLGFEYEMGLSLWDINFRGERLVYELTPQEAMAQYSGNDPIQSSTVWLDRAFGMGGMVREMMVGYDCPVDALYLPATVHADFGTTTRLNGICVFERDSGKPISRHTGWLKDEMGSTKGYELVVRSIATVGNYDYLFDYTFMLDGSFEIRISASGYLQGGHFDTHQEGYGYRIAQSSMGTLHDHVINYKIDFDVAGRRNSLAELKLEVEEKETPWLEDGWGDKLIQQHITRHLVRNEDDAQLNYHANGQGVYVITSEDALNEWGNARGYAIHPGASPIHLTNLNSKRTERSVEWAKHSLGVTQQKDNERYSSSLWNMNLPGKPPVDFGKFFNSESLEQEDLVLWINVGTHHIVRSEDAPHTLTNLATSSVLFAPFNYFDFDVSMEVQNSVILNAPEPGSAWDISSIVEAPYCLPPRLPRFNYTGLLAYDEDGNPAKAESISQQRKRSEAQHAFFAEL